MNRAPTCVRPAANATPLCRDAVPTLPIDSALDSVLDAVIDSVILTVTSDQSDSPQKRWLCQI